MPKGKLTCPHCGGPSGPKRIGVICGTCLDTKCFLCFKNPPRKKQFSAWCEECIVFVIEDATHYHTTGEFRDPNEAGIDPRAKKLREARLSRSYRTEKFEKPQPCGICGEEMSKFQGRKKYCPGCVDFIDRFAKKGTREHVAAKLRSLHRASTSFTFEALAPHFLTATGKLPIRYEDQPEEYTDDYLPPIWEEKEEESYETV